LGTPVFTIAAVRGSASFRDVKGIGKLAAVSAGPSPAVVDDVQFFKKRVHGCPFSDASSQYAKCLCKNDARESRNVSILGNQAKKYDKTIKNR